MRAMEEIGYETTVSCDIGLMMVDGTNSKARLVRVHV